MILYDKNEELLEEYQIISNHFLTIPRDGFSQITTPWISGKIKSSNLPLNKIDSETLAGGKKILSGVTFPDAVSFEIYENTDFSTYQFFDKWLSNNYDAERCIFYPKGKPDKRNCTVEFFNTIVGGLFAKTPNNTVKASFSMYNCMCLGIEPTSLSQENNEPLTYTVTLSVDQIKNSYYDRALL
ncbi:MAG: hypothetical protein GF311_28230 [Candidatus Lokiarchaeota archaeon]|nr:hypothetical protein [Candidatus Lokiarchaeota archaeon]